MLPLPHLITLEGEWGPLFVFCVGSALTYLFRLFFFSRGGCEQLVDYLHYRIVDVSSLFEVVRRWYPSKMWQWSQQERSRTQATNTVHRAMSDIKYSIRRTYPRCYYPAP